MVQHSSWLCDHLRLPPDVSTTPGKGSSLYFELRDRYGSLVSLRRTNGASKSSEASKGSISNLDTSFPSRYEELNERDSINLIMAAAVLKSSKSTSEVV